VVSGQDRALTGGGSQRPNLIGDPNLPSSQRTPQLWYNPATVVVPTDRSQPFGNAGRNIVRAPSFYQLDLGLHKDFPITETMKLSFRTEAFNLLNKTNFSAPNGNRSSSAFGSITSTYPARQMQFAQQRQLRVAQQSHFGFFGGSNWNSTW